MYAIIETGGKQYKVEAGDVVFIEKLDFVKASYTAKDGTVAVDWKRNGDTVVINIELTGKVYGKIILPNGFAFEDNSREKELKTAEYTAFKLEKYGLAEKIYDLSKLYGRIPKKK